MKGFKIIGHRGWGPTHNSDIHCLYPENTFIAFDHALSGGADGIEFDVLLSKDNIPVVIHDRHLGRHVIPEQKTIVADRFVADFTFEELQRFDLGQGQRIPSLHELLVFIDNKYPSTIINMDVKNPDLVGPILEEINKSFSGPRDNIVISSYDWDLLRSFREADPDINLVPAIKSAILFGAENIRQEDFMPMTDKYLSAAREAIFGIKKEIECIAFDCSVTDLKQPLIDWAAKCGVGLQISTSNDRVDAVNTDYGLLKSLVNAANERLPFVICKVDEPSLVKAALAEHLKQKNGSYSPESRSPNFI